MKYIVILADGMSDYPCEKLGGMTPMEYARKPALDYLASRGEVFLVKTVADGMEPGSDIANLSIMGYDPEVYYTGRSPLEAASIGVSLSDDEMAFRCNLVSLSEGEEGLIMKDYSAGEIPTGEAAELIKAVNARLSGGGISFYSGVSYRHLMVWSGASGSFNLTPPHNIINRPIGGCMPENDTIRKLMMESREILKEHPVNKKRAARGENTADSIWIWGEGKRPRLSPFYEMHGLSGCVISAVDLIKGIGILSGMKNIDVEGATGTIDTNFKGKAQAALSAVRGGCDFVYLHIEAPDECGHQGDAAGKARSIELIDSEVIRPIYEELRAEGGDFKIMVLPDHPTPLALRTHARDPVPCVIYDSRKTLAGPKIFTEKTAAAQGKLFAPGHALIKKLVNGGREHENEQKGG